MSGSGSQLDRPRGGRWSRILAIDVGGTGLKASVLGERGRMLSPRVRVKTPDPCPPDVLLGQLADLVRPLSPFQCVAVGFPGMVRDGRVITAPNLGPAGEYAGVDLAGELSRALGKPVRVINDAEMQGFGAIRGRGVELVVTFGTGVGTGLFDQGLVAPHLEIAHHPFRHGQTYEEQLGKQALKKVGRKTWNRRVEIAIETLRALVHFDHLYIGGGNAKKVTLKLGADATIVPNTDGLIGGVRLWNPRRP
ncbi:MAG TPA: ROK family protein [Vicinamibacterales bacterium]|nr:ROK family protein [Vicinamibacterales bacterium]